MKENNKIAQITNSKQKQKKTYKKTNTVQIQNSKQKQQTTIKEKKIFSLL